MRAAVRSHANQQQRLARHLLRLALEAIVELRQRLRPRRVAQRSAHLPLEGSRLPPRLRRTFVSAALPQGGPLACNVARKRQCWSAFLATIRSSLPITI